MPSTIETFAATGKLDPATREALRPPSTGRRFELERLGFAPAATAALAQYRRECAGGSVPGVGRRLSRADRLLVHSVAGLGLSPSAVASALGVSAHWATLQLRLVAVVLAAAFDEVEGDALAA